MKNEYDVQLDRNGYAPSILPGSEGHCFVCNRYMRLERHEIFHGTGRRDKSKAYGLWVNLCHHCHFIVHNSDGKLDNALKMDGQQAAMDHYEWTVEDFRKRFGKSYL